MGMWDDPSVATPKLIHTDSETLALLVLYEAKKKAMLLAVLLLYIYNL